MKNQILNIKPNICLLFNLVFSPKSKPGGEGVPNSGMEIKVIQTHFQLCSIMKRIKRENSPLIISKCKPAYINICDRNSNLKPQKQNTYTAEIVNKNNQKLTIYMVGFYLFTVQKQAKTNQFIINQKCRHIFRCRERHRSYFGCVGNVLFLH